MTNIKPINNEIIKLAKFLNGYDGYGKTEEWHLNQMKWLKFEDLYKYATAKYIHKTIQSNEDHMFKDILISKRRGRNLSTDKLSPINSNMTQNSNLFKFVSIYSSLPNILTQYDNKQHLKNGPKDFTSRKKLRSQLKIDQKL